MRVSRIKAERGVGAVELAVSLSILTVLVLGIVEYGRFIYLRSSLQSALDVAARQYRVETQATAGEDGNTNYVHPSDAWLVGQVKQNYPGDTSKLSVATTNGYYHQAFTFDSEPFGYQFREVRAQLPLRLAVPFLGSASELTVEAVARIPIYGQY